MIDIVVKTGGNCIKASPGKIKCPVLLTYSENDSFLPNVKNIAKELQGKIKNSKIKVFSN